MTSSIKLVYCIRRLPHLDHVQFQAYWRDVHAPIVLERAAILGIRRYVQSRALNDNYSKSLAKNRGGPPAFDGIAELLFESRESQTEESRHQARVANTELIADERRFIDLSASPMFLVEEHLMLEKDANGVIRDFLQMRRPD
jgi:uncharacterized protein (TIGR02118 family)